MLVKQGQAYYGCLRVASLALDGYLILYLSL